MVTTSRSASIEDEHQIASLLIRWGHARHSDDWETPAGCFHDEATIHIYWMSGTGQGVHRSLAVYGHGTQARRP